MTEPRKTARCAIYTRKSTEHNLDLEFNSLDAQREACEAYIKSQAHEGWRLVPGEFNDGAYSGASLERPALQALISEIAAGKVDVVVVYKVDRLTRSLTDFAKLVDLFDRHGVSFVSITQSFNTTTSMGRLTLNVLLSFAQFEREVIGERVRDKIAASKRKGLWMGGPVPLGYASVDKKLVIVEPEAETVRSIFRRYLNTRSLQTLAAELKDSGVRTKERKWSNDRVVGGVNFGTGPLLYLLRNRVYLGEVVHNTAIHLGEQAPIIDRELFDAVQEKLSNRKVERVLRLKSSPALLAGKLFDDKNNRMTPSHTRKKGVRYRYYISGAILDGNKDGAGSVSRVPAAEIEALVLQKMQENVGRFVTTDEGARTLLEGLQCAILEKDTIVLHLEPKAAGADPVVLSLPWMPPVHLKVKGITRLLNSGANVNEGGRDALLTAIAKARSWIEKVSEDKATIGNIAEGERKSERHIRLLLPLAFVPPAELTAIAEGRIAPGTTVTGLAQRIKYTWPSSTMA